MAEIPIHFVWPHLPHKIHGDHPWGRREETPIRGLSKTRSEPMRVEFCFGPQNATRIRERGFGLKYTIVNLFKPRIELSRSVDPCSGPASKSALIFCMAIKPQRRRSIHVANLNHTRQRGPQDLCACPYWMAGADVSAFVRERSKCASQEHDLRRPRPPRTFCMAGARSAHTWRATACGQLLRHLPVPVGDT